MINRCVNTPAQLPGVLPEVVYVTSYTPGVDASRSIAPVDELITRPDVEVNVPPEAPVMVGVGSASMLQ